MVRLQAAPFKEITTMKAITAILFIIGAALLGYEMFVRYVGGNVQADFMPAVSVLVLAMAVQVIWGRTAETA